jgi:hypothetical protein
VFPPPVGIGEIMDPTPTPTSYAVPVAAKLTVGVYATRTPVSSLEKVAAPIVTPWKPDNIQRPAVTAFVSHMAYESAPAVKSPVPVGAIAPGVAPFVWAKF